MAALVLPWAGCDSGKRVTAKPPAETPKGAPIETVEIEGDKLKTEVAEPDAALAARVQARIAADPRVGAGRVEADAQHGKVTLWGKVSGTEARIAAEQRARETPGVAAVSNLISIDGASRPGA